MPAPRLVAPPPTVAVAASNPGDNWPLPPAELERILGWEDFEIRSINSAGGGVTGAYKAELNFPAVGRTVKVKLKVVPPGLDGWNNSPRKELAAYQVQKLFLAPADFVVPTTTARCVPVDELPPAIASTPETVAGTHCVVVILSVWLENVEVPEPLFDVDAYRADPGYARRLGEFNLLTHLIGHRDGRRGNFLVSRNRQDRRVFAIDNGISIGPWIYNYFVPNWNEIRVPTLPSDAIARLRLVTRSQLDELGVVAELRRDENGVLRTARPGANLDTRSGARWRAGVLQFGLRATEIDVIARTLRDLLRRVDSDLARAGE